MIRLVITHFLAIFLQFEAQLLTGKKISNESEALEAMKVLHDKGVRIVILSSTDFSSHGQLMCLASQKDTESQELRQARIEFPALPTHFVGTGDLFTALTTGKHWSNITTCCVISRNFCTKKMNTATYINYNIDVEAKLL